MSNDFEQQARNPDYSASDPADAARKMMPNDYPTTPGGATGAYGDYGQYGERGNDEGNEREGYRGRRMMPNDYLPPVERRRSRIPLPVKLLGGCLAVGVILLLIAGCLVGGLASATFASPSATSTSSQSFNVSGTPLVRLRNDVGNVTVQSGDNNTVQVEVEKHAQSFLGASTQSGLSAIKVTMTQSGNTIDVSVDVGDSNGFWSHRWVDLTITTPATSNLNFTDSAGNIDVGGISGTMVLKSNAGNVSVSDGTLTNVSTIQSDAGNVKLDTVTVNANTSLRSNAGNVDFNGTLGQHVAFEAHSDAGNVRLTLPANTSAHLTATTSAGSISIDSTWSVPVNKDFATASASGDLGTNPTTTITASTDAGNVTIQPQ